MRRLAVIALILMFATVPVLAAEGWETDFSKARAAAKAKKLPIFINFTGSDWCPWCVKLEKEIFSKKEWKDWAKENLVLYVADFPRNKKVDDAIMKVNKELKNKYGVRGFPTLVLIDAEEKKLGQVGYQQGGPEPFIETVKDTLNPKPVPTGKNKYGWYVNFEEAKKVSASSKRPILLGIFVTGRDPNSEKALKDIFNTPKFKTFAGSKVVPFMADFAEKSVSMRNQNMGIVQKLKLRPQKLPMLMFLNADGTLKADLPLYAETAEKFIEDAGTVLNGGTLTPPPVSSEGVTKQKNEHGWYVNYQEAMRIAKEKKLPVLADFMGSDWCSWCIKLDKEVFTQKEWKQYAAKNLVLLSLDYPRRKKQDEALKKQNSELQDRYGVRGFPTVLLLDANGKIIAKTGYQKGGAAGYVKHMKELLGKN